MRVQPYLLFDGRCEEALNFYAGALGAEILSLMRFKDSPLAEETGVRPPGSGDKIMNTSFRIGDSLLMASDGLCEGNPQFKGVSLSITLPDAAQANRIFAALAEGGVVLMPMTETFFAQRFGMVADRFGLSWMVLAAPVEGV
jgi:PhnB protein